MSKSVQVAWVHESGSVWEAHSWSLGVRGSQARVYHFMIRDSEIGRQSGMELGQQIWNVSLSAKQIYEIVNFWTFLENEIERYTECWFFPCWVSRVKYLCQMCMIFCVYFCCACWVNIPMYFQLSFSAVCDCWG